MMSKKWITNYLHAHFFFCRAEYLNEWGFRFPFSLNFTKSENCMQSVGALVRDGPSQGNTSASIEGTQKREREKSER